jgi:protein-disulfide isomerase
MAEVIDQSSKQSDNYIRIPLPSKNTTTPVLIILLAIASFYSGYATSEIKNLRAGTTTKPTTVAANISGAPAAAPTEDTSPKKVALSDAPILGDKNAPVTIIEFSDYECPFCKQYFTQTYSQILKDYVDTGKVKIAFRNLPLSFHQNAHKEAEAALCARDQGGDDAYWKFHDEMFTKTTSNGLGLALTELPNIANNLGFNGDTLQKCLDDGKYTKTVDDDLAYSSTVGASATPTFFIGKSDSSGTITGTPLIGAQPYSTFKSTIDSLL